MDVENGEGGHGAHSIWAKIASNKLAGRNVNSKGSIDTESTASGEAIYEESAENSKQTLELIIDKNPDEQQRQPLVEKEKRKADKVKKAAKPPRPPNGPTLDAADMRLIKEITDIAMKKREKVERIKATRKIQAARSQSPPSSCGSTFVATIITILFALVLIFQGFGTNTYAISDSSEMMGAPLPSPETEGPAPVQFYKTVMPDDDRRK